MLSFFRSILFFAGCICCVGVASAGQEGPLKVYLLLGQSNMLGMRSKIDDLPANLKSAYAGAYYFKNGKWVSLNPGEYQDKGFGPELSFVKSIKKSGVDVGIIKVAEGDTALYNEWYPQAGRLYKETLKVVAEARKSRSITLAGILWMQGETDGEYGPMARDYEKDFTKLIEVMRSELSASNIPFVACTVSAPKDDYPYVDIVAQAQKSVSVQGYKYVDCSGLTKGPDNLHYDTDGQVEMGRLFAKAMTN